MRILLVKTSSLGDVIHNLPVVSDLVRSFPDAEIDWCVEESLADIPRLHAGVGEIIPVAIRRWRKGLTQKSTWREIGAFRERLGAKLYDVVLDTQGLVKSGLVAWQARGVRCGYAAEAAREPFAARFYDLAFAIPRNVHAVQRNRWLAAAALDYPVDLPLDYGIVAPKIAADWLPEGRYAVLFSATSRDDKLWDEANWIVLATALSQRGLLPVLPSGSAVERQRAERIVAALPGNALGNALGNTPGAVLAPPLKLTALASLVARAALVVGVDTGLAHLAAALRVPVIALYVSTDPALTGVYGSGFVRNLGERGRAPTVEEVLMVAEQALRV
jgi:heptosyltransferase-1